jgi:hypothetical protein
MRETWRSRALTKDEWITNPFSGRRYSMVWQYAVPLFRKQWIGAKKTGTGEGKPNGPYGEVYAKRSKHTLTTHPDWTDGHRQKDALRIMMKAFLKDLYVAWRAAERGEDVSAEENESAKETFVPNHELEDA